MFSRVGGLGPLRPMVTFEMSGTYSRLHQGKGATLNLDSILSDLKAERRRLSRAIEALEDTAVSTSEDSVKTVTKTLKTAGRKAFKMSDEARKQLSDAKKKWWAKRKKL